MFSGAAVYSPRISAEGIASAADCARTLIAHDGNIDGGFASLQGGQTMFFTAARAEAATSSCSTANRLPPPWAGMPVSVPQAESSRARAAANKKLKRIFFFCLVDYWLKIVFPFRAADFIL